MNDLEKTLQLYETFSSIQGESTHAGRPCFFIRLAGCNLRCSYCDTKKAQLISAGTPLSLKELVNRAKTAGIPLVEITGGEPMLQKETPELCRALLDAGFQVMMETNGSLDTTMLPEKVMRILDIKTPSSGESAGMCDANFTNLRPHDEVKMVVADRADYEFALERIRHFDLLRQTPNVLFSPVFGSISAAELVKWILEDNVSVRINLQLHKIIWGADAEGV